MARRSNHQTKTNFNHPIDALFKYDAWRAVKYLDPKLVLRATRRLYGGKILRRGPFEVMLTLGRPNYRERQFIKDCIKAGEPFPVKKVWLQFPPKKRVRK